MKIIIDVSQLVYSGHGVGRYTEYLIRALLEQKSEHSFTLYAGALQNMNYFKNLSKTSPYNRADWKLSPLPPRLAAQVFNTTQLSIDTFVGKGDIFHSSDWTQPWTVMKKVTTVHDLAFKKYPETIDPLVLSTQEKRLKRVVDFGVHIIADSMSTKKDLMKYYQIASEKIDVVYPGATYAKMKVPPQKVREIKEKYHIRGKYIVSVGTLEPRKNLQMAIKAFEQFRQTKIGKEYSLVLSGRVGWGKAIVQPPCVTTTGFVDEQDLTYLYAGADIFLYPSLYEGFGFPVLEAMQCGTPVVTSNISSLPEVAGDAAILVDPTSAADIAIGLSRAMEKRRSLIEKGYKQAALFTWENTAKQVIKVYEKLMYVEH